MEKRNAKRQKNWIDAEEVTVVNTIDMGTFKEATVKHALALHTPGKDITGIYEYLAALYLANVLTKEQYLDITDAIHEELTIDTYM